MASETGSAVLIISDLTPPETRQILTACNIYLQLAFSLVPGALTNREVRQGIEDVGRWLDSCSDADIVRKAPRIARSYEPVLAGAISKLPPKKAWTEIAQDYWELCRDKAFTFSTGLCYGWLSERFQCAAVGIPDDFPYHGRIGVGHHAGFAFVEEETLLRDAFFLLAKARVAKERLDAAGRGLAGSNVSYAEHGWLSALNGNVATFSRLCVFSFYSFVECFINSVAEDFVQRNPNLTPAQKEKLRGTKNGRYISTEKKLELFPGTIRGDGQRHITLSDVEQIAEPFTSFKVDVKQLRDASAHYSRSKASIWKGPADWISDAEMASRSCVGVAGAFWKACYPLRAFPAYLQGLDPARYEKDADQRAREDGVEIERLVTKRLTDSKDA